MYGSNRGRDAIEAWFGMAVNGSTYMGGGKGNNPDTTRGPYTIL